MKVLITGGAGFLGRRLAMQLLARGTLSGPDGTPQPIDRLTLLDIVPAEGITDPRVACVTGDIADPAVTRGLIDAGTGSVFHLAAVVSGQAEADFELGYRINLDGSRAVLEACRAAGSRPRVVFTSSVAVHGGDMPAVVQDDTALNPQSSYGVQKAIGELLLSDYTRKGFVDGRILRLPTVSVRPGRPNKAASSFASGIIREPLNGEEAVCPVPPDTSLWLLSPRKAVECLIRGHELPSDALGRQRAINLPGLSVRVDEMVAALRRVAGEEVASRIRWEPDAAITRIVASWPGAWNPARAEALGLSGDSGFEAVIRAYMEDELGRPA
ncbi:D-erythronate dehydrogenase [Azospirillum thermophilum]|uniref:NAD-dependent epimerase n=1 Tax=Azospirillum thermophilum TaxID=2202148 RepID=A0A2S2CUF9_9PROT|nr:D-erythronate dehydrogenase [Azospirillum thermophilum]AWK88154.1 NAD-dependent epimerase [Azospirillum thermophilum]